jgi:pimeloyl-ACP methyl ester carboxylesterase
MPNVTSLLRAAKAGTKPTVIALHCSGATQSEWRQLERGLSSCFTMVAPGLIGSGAIAHWEGTHTFHLADEAAQVVRIIDSATRPVHLVGHSYGGCVMLRAAIERSSKIASLTLYEPAAFHLLKMNGDDGKIALGEITALSGDIKRYLSSGDHHAAAKQFFEYWNAGDSWAAARVETRDVLVRYIPKFSFEFSAAMSEKTPLHAYRRLNFPILLLQGEHAPAPTQMIARQLAKAMRFASLQTVYGAGHMGPFTHAAVVAAMMTDWIIRSELGLAASEHLVEPKIDRVA